MRAILLFSVLMAASCETTSTNPSAQKQAVTEPAALEVVPVLQEWLATTERIPGEITPYESVALYPRVSGFVDQVLVDRGSRVRRGQLLARLSAPELAAQRAEAESKLLASTSTYERTMAAAETPGAVAKHDLEVNEATVKAEQARVRSLKALEDYLSVRAPFDGVVTERNVHPGALVGPPAGGSAAPMLRMESVGHLRLTVAVPETDVGSIADGAKAEFGVRTWPGRKFSGIIRRISHALDARTRTMPVELDVDNRDNKLAPGMFVEVFWPVRRSGPSLFVSASAVVQTTEMTYVDRVKNGIVERVPVQRGATVKDRVEVFGALAPGDMVLRRGSEELKQGAKVQARVWKPDGSSTK